VPHLLQLILVCLAAAAGGAVNSIAGGGTLLTFPSLVGLGIPPIVANATSTVALWPGAVSSMWGYRRELAGARTWAFRFALPSLLGGLAGAILLLHTPAGTFDLIVPWLVIGATLLFTAQEAIMRLVRGHVVAASPVGTTLPPPATPLLVAQFLIGVYGGYFGAGIGILMLATLGLMGLTNIHQMNGLKNWGGLCMNLVAAVTFASSSLVNWPVALTMAAGATAGGYAGARLAQRVPQRAVRRAIVGIGFSSGVWLLLERL
jgi:uncharacterized membrane protein YfcA